MSKPIIIGADVSKGYADFIAIDSNKKVLVELFQLDDNKTGHSALTDQLQSLRENHRCNRILFAVESTGGLEDNWLRTVKKAPLSGFVEGYRINPKLTHHEYRVQKRNSVSDRVSSLTIAHHVAKNLESFSPTEIVENPEYTAARSLIRHLVGLAEQCTEHKNSLQQLLYQYYPSLVPFVPKAWSRYFLNILITYGSKKSIQSAASRGFKQVSHVPKDKATQIHEALKEGIGPEETPTLVIATVQSKARKILEAQQEISELESLLCQAAPVSKEQLELLCSMKGMGRVTATILLCFIEDVDRFDNASSMAAFFGVPPRVKTSGDGKVTIGMSKQGSGIVRRELYLLAFRSLQNLPYLKSIYAKFRKKGMVHDAALGVLMHKLLRMIYGILSNGTTFDPGIDQLNQVDPRGKQADDPSNVQELVKEEPKRRLQDRSGSAPLSVRERRKRKKDQESQAATEAEIAGSS